MRHSLAVPLVSVVFLTAGGRALLAGSEESSTIPPPPHTLPVAEKANPVPVMQPVQEYFFPLPKDYSGDSEDQSPFAPWAYYTHLGTDYGLMGPGQQGITWKAGEITVDLTHGGWAGMWHSLAGVVREKNEYLDFMKCYPPWVRDEYQPHCVGIVLRAGGQGSLKVEVVSPRGNVLWMRTQLFPPGSPTHELVLDCSPAELREAKQLNWVAEPGSLLHIDSLELLLEYPQVSLGTRVFLVSYAKLARCYVPTEGLVKDRAHFPAGAFETVPGSGLFCLATCAAWRMGMVDRAFAEQTLHQVYQRVATLPHALGLLPHFVTKQRGLFRIHPGSEYSTVDTSLFYHSMLLAAQMLSDQQTVGDLGRDVHQVQFQQLRDSEGFILRGLEEDGRTRLSSSWHDWGGETALVLLLERMAAGEGLPLKMDHAGKVPGGVGFIGEIQSLFYPQFSLDESDALTGVDWLQARRQLLQEQMEYFPRTQPQSAAARMGLYGLSAGEGLRGANYSGDGAEFPDMVSIHPHYILMSGMVRLPPTDVYHLIENMEASGLLPPWGMVEYVKADFSEYLPMLGSLNASFECLGAYHLWAGVKGTQDQIYEAAGSCVLLKDAIQAFYPLNRGAAGLQAQNVRTKNP